MRPQEKRRRQKGSRRRYNTLEQDNEVLQDIDDRAYNDAHDTVLERFGGKEPGNRRDKDRFTNQVCELHQKNKQDYLQQNIVQNGSLATAGNHHSLCCKHLQSLPTRSTRPPADELSRERARRLGLEKEIAKLRKQVKSLEPLFSQHLTCRTPSSAALHRPKTHVATPTVANLPPRSPLVGRVVPNTVMTPASVLEAALAPPQSQGSFAQVPTASAAVTSVVTAATLATTASPSATATPVEGGSSGTCAPNASITLRSNLIGQAHQEGEQHQQTQQPQTEQQAQQTGTAELGRFDNDWIPESQSHQMQAQIQAQTQAYAQQLSALLSLDESGSGLLDCWFEERGRGDTTFEPELDGEPQTPDNRQSSGGQAFGRGPLPESPPMSESAFQLAPYRYMYAGGSTEREAR